MSIKKSLTTAALSLASILLASQSSSAATLTYTTGDLFLAFRASTGTGATSDYLINIGQASTYRDATSAFTLNIGDIGTDLSNLYGSDWSDRSDVLWGVIGATPSFSSLSGDPQATLYASRASIYDSGSDTFSSPTAWTNASASSQRSVVNRYIGLGDAYKTTGGTPNPSAPNSDVAFVQSTSQTNSWASYITADSGSDFLFFVPSIEGSFANGAAGAGLDLFRLLAGSASPSNVSNEGRFTIDSAGTITFTPVPEPSTWAMLGLGAVVLGVIARRRKAAALQA